MSPAPPPLAPPAPGAWLPEIERAVAALQREEALRQAAQQSGQPGPAEEPNPVYGELPGEGYLFSHDPETRQKALVRTTPEDVRMALLRAIEDCAMNLLPYGETPAKDLGQAALAYSQAYLLLDPSVDAEGIPLQHHVELNAAAQAIAAENKPKTEALRNARGQRPRPQPRVGG